MRDRGIVEEVIVMVAGLALFAMTVLYDLMRWFGKGRDEDDGEK